jgi:hypothetical protein
MYFYLLDFLSIVYRYSFRFPFESTLAPPAGSLTHVFPSLFLLSYEAKNHARFGKTSLSKENRKGMW